MTNLLTRILKIGEGRKVKALWRAVEAVSNLEPQVEELSDEKLAGHDRGVSEAARRGRNARRHY